MSHAEIHHTLETPWKTNDDDAGRRNVLERLARHELSAEQAAEAIRALRKDVR